jgi:hypothetical protein
VLDTDFEKDYTLYVVKKLKFRWLKKQPKKRRKLLRPALAVANRSRITA